MAADWFPIINKDEFLATELTSRNLTLFLTGIGQKDILVTKGELVGITYEGVFLPLQLNGNNPFVFEGHAVFLDVDHIIWLGIDDGED